MIDWIAMIAAMAILVWALCSDGSVVGRLWLAFALTLGIAWFVAAG